MGEGDMSEIAHARLVLAAARWLKRAGYPIVVTEMATSYQEVPDAIGLGAGGSTLIECKISRADFLSDSKKFFRVCPSSGMGAKRYYLCPANLIASDEVPEGWGLIYLCAHNRLRDIRGATEQPRNEGAKRAIFISILRRIAWNPPEGVGIKLYATTFKTQKTTVGIVKEETIHEQAGL
jgi:hypothetical protein